MPQARAYEIDLLRFCAAVAVVFFHWSFRGGAIDGPSVLSYPWLAPAARYGFLGVELFFMISGFVILMSASGGSVRDFVVSRLVRLYPAFWVCCSLTFVWAWVMADSKFVFTAWQYLVNLSMLSGFVGVPSIDGVYWSLFVEIRFYLLVLLVLAMGWMRRIDLLLWLWLAVAVLQQVVHSGPLWHWLIAPHAAYFIAGAACYLIYRHGGTPQRYLLIAGAWVLALYRSVQGLDELEKQLGGHFDPFIICLLISFFFALMLGVATGRLGALRRRAWLSLGMLTYPLYLLHQNIGYMVFNRWHERINIHWLFWGSFAAMLLAAWAVHRWVERPLARRMKTKLDRVFQRHAALPAQ
jgi:peptidoglycan/LPS O-acetylase OafA/YrhL